VFGDGLLDLQNEAPAIALRVITTQVRQWIPKSSNSAERAPNSARLRQSLEMSSTMMIANW